MTQNERFNSGAKKEHRKNLKVFESKQIRTSWDEAEEKWYFSIVDVVGALTDQPDYDGARNYRKVLKNRPVKRSFRRSTPKRSV